MGGWVEVNVYMGGKKKKERKKEVRVVKEKRVILCSSSSSKVLVFCFLLSFLSCNFLSLFSLLLFSSLPSPQTHCEEREREGGIEHDVSRLLFHSPCS